MKLGGSVSDEQQQLPSREIVRNCGQLLGRLDDLLPVFTSRSTARPTVTCVRGKRMALQEHFAFPRLQSVP